MPQPAVPCRLHKEHLPHSQKDSALPDSFLKKKKKKVLQSSSDWKWIHSLNLQRLNR